MNLRNFQHVCVFLFLALLSLAILHPIILDFDSRMIGWKGDNVQYVYIIGQIAQSLEKGESILKDTQHNVPDGLFLTATDVPYLPIISLIPLTFLYGEIWTYNFITFLGFWLSGIFTYLWIWKRTNSIGAGLIAGMIFVLTPYRVVHSYGHLNLVSTFGLPLFFWSLDLCLQDRAIKVRRLFALALSTILVGLCCQYYLMIVMITGVGYILLTSIRFPRQVLRYGWLILLCIGIAAFIGSLPYLLTFEHDVYKPYDHLDQSITSLDPFLFILPSKLHPIFGSLARSIRPNTSLIEKTMYLGVIALFLSIISLIRTDYNNRLISRIWLGMTILGVILGLGTHLHIGDLPYPDHDSMVLPVYYLSQLPFFDLMRIWSRFGIVSILFVSLLAGLGMSKILNCFPRYRIISIIIIATLIIIDFLPGTLPTCDLKPRPIDYLLSSQQEETQAVFLPVNDTKLCYFALYGSLFHNVHFIIYLHSQHKPALYRIFEEYGQNFPARDAVRSIRDMGVKFIIVQKQKSTRNKHSNLSKSGNIDNIQNIPMKIKSDGSISQREKLERMPEVHKTLRIDEFLIVELE